MKGGENENKGHPISNFKLINKIMEVLLLMQIIKKVVKTLKNERGAYGAVELMAIVAVVIVVSVAVTSKLSGENGLPSAADSAVETINQQIVEATGGDAE